MKSLYLNGVVIRLFTIYMNNKITVGVDVDDVLLDTLPLWLEHLNGMTGQNLKCTDITDWHIKDFVRDPFKPFVFNPLNYSVFWKSVLPIESSIEPLQEMLSDDKLKIYIVSATWATTPNEKWKRFVSLFPFVDIENIILIHDKQLLGLDYIIDDNPRNLKENDILINKPHNKCLDDEKMGIYRVNTLSDAYEIIKEDKCYIQTIQQ